MDPFNDMTEFSFCPFMEPITAYDDNDNDNNGVRLEKNFPKQNQTDRIYNIIRRNNPMIIRRLVICGIPPIQAERIIKRIITLHYLIAGKF